MQFLATTSKLTTSYYIDFKWELSFDLKLKNGASLLVPTVMKISRVGIFKIAAAELVASALKDRQ